MDQFDISFKVMLINGNMNEHSIRIKPFALKSYL